MTLENEILHNMENGASENSSESVEEMNADSFDSLLDEEIKAVEENSVLIPPLSAEETETLRLRVVEALLFASNTPLDENTILKHLQRGPIGDGADVAGILSDLQQIYQNRGLTLVNAQGRWSLRTAADLGSYLRLESTKPVKLSRSVSETLAVIAYHQPITRAEIEAIRGVATSKGVLDYLMQLGWVRPGQRRETPGRPLTWVTTSAFLDHFGLISLQDLPGVEELRAAGLLETQVGMTYGVIKPDQQDDLPTALDDQTEEDLPDFVPSALSAEDEEDNTAAKEDAFI